MRPIKLWMTAFGPYAGTEIVDFRAATDAGLFGIYGPTGSGKSSIFSAMSFALFGEGAREDQKARTMRSDHADASTLTEVSFLFELGSKRYFVRRQPDQARPKLRGEGETEQAHKAWLFDATGVEIDALSIDNAGKVLAETKVGEVNARILDLLKYDVDQFRQIVLLPQGKFERFLASDSKARLEILRGLFDISLYQRMTRRLSEQANEALREVQDGLRIRHQRLGQAGFASSDELVTAIEQAEQQCADKLLAFNAADGARNLAEQILAAGETLTKMFVEYELAEKAVADLEARSAEIEEASQRHGAAVQAQKLIDRDEAVVRARRIHQEAKDKVEEGERHAETVGKAEERAQQTVDALKAKSSETDALKRQASDLERFHALITGAADLKVKADQANAALSVARASSNAAEEEAAKLGALVESQRAELEQAQANELARVSVVGRQAAAQRELQKAQEIDRAREAVQASETSLVGAEREALSTQHESRVAEEEVSKRQAAFIAGQATLLASRLEAGAPCPVCGSEEHPTPAHASGVEHGLEEAMRKAEAIQRATAGKLQEASSKLSAARLLLEERNATLARLTPTDEATEVLQARVIDLDDQLATLGEAIDIETLKSNHASARQSLTAAEARRKSEWDNVNAVERLEAASRRSYDDQIASVPAEHRNEASVSKLRISVTQDIARREEAVERAQAEFSKCSAHNASAMTDLANANNRVGECAIEIEAAVNAFELRRSEVGLTQKAFAVARSDIDQIDKLSTLISAHRDALIRAKGRKEDTGKAIDEHERPDIAILLTACEDARSLASEAAQNHANARALSDTLTGLRTSLASEHARLEKLEADTAPLRDLAAAFEGNNLVRTNLETYAIGAMFDQVLEAANLRLAPMTLGRYRLERDTQSIGGRKRRGLDILVHDIQTGKAREVSTLSGGETFMAALSLALGLSDIVEMSHGAIRLDTIFIDEGFGSLDSDGESGTLDHVLQVLQNIVGQRRAVGLVSHVDSVKQAVPNGFNIIKSAGGSRIESRLG